MTAQMSQYAVDRIKELEADIAEEQERGKEKDRKITQLEQLLRALRSGAVLAA